MSKKPAQALRVNATDREHVEAARDALVSLCKALGTYKPATHPDLHRTDLLADVRARAGEVVAVVADDRLPDILGRCGVVDTARWGEPFRAELVAVGDDPEVYFGSVAWRHNVLFAVRRVLSIDPDDDPLDRRTQARAEVPAADHHWLWENRVCLYHRLRDEVPRLSRFEARWWVEAVVNVAKAAKALGCPDAWLATIETPDEVHAGAWPKMAMLVRGIVADDKRVQMTRFADELQDDMHHQLGGTSMWYAIREASRAAGQRVYETVGRHLVNLAARDQTAAVIPENRRHWYYGDCRRVAAPLPPAEVVTPAVGVVVQEAADRSDGLPFYGAEKMTVPEQESAGTFGSNGLMAAKDIAAKFGVNKATLEKRLSRHAEKYPDCRIETSSPRKNDPQYFYRCRDVAHIVVDLKAAEGRRRLTGVGRGKSPA